MLFYSTNNKNHKVSLKEAVLKGLAEDNGLYMPESIQSLSATFVENIDQYSFQEIAFEIARTFLKGAIDEKVLKTIVDETLAFDAPLVALNEHTYVLELFHGPTLAFKDFGARFMSLLVRHFVGEGGKKLTVLVATSGDTGSAVASGFLGVANTEVFILYPKGKVSHLQELQLTTLGQNITALEVDGTFDDCQYLVKQAFLDAELNRHLQLTSANSINIARLLPQSFYYAYAYAQLKKKKLPVVFSVPSGNFGNLTAGLLLKAMGLPIQQFVASTNVNDSVPQYLASGEFTPKASVQTISNAMDVGNPSNFARMKDLYNNELSAFRKEIQGYTFTDAVTKEAIREVYQQFNYTIDPHGAVAYLGLKEYRKQFPGQVNGVILETAHPAKFKEVVEEVLKKEVSLPAALKELLNRKKENIAIGKDFSLFKKQLLELVKERVS